MGELINPYIAGAPVTEARMFFGREDVFQWIENSIAGQYADHILVIHGQRRVGKTSVLKQLGNRLPKRFIPVFFDLQGRTHTTLDRFLWWLAREIVRVLKQDRGIEVPLPDKDAFAADIEYFEHRFLPDLKPALGNDTLLLTFDEFDNLEESEVKEELARPLTDYLRRLMGNGGLNFIFSIGSSGRKLENMQAAYTEFFKTALYKKISFLNEDQTRNLITRPVENILEYDRRAVTRIYQLAGGHPYFTQLTCHELFAKCQQSDERIIKEADVESVLDDVVERGTVNLKFVWDEASDIEKWCLSALAQLDKGDNRAIAEYLRKNRVRFSDTDLASGLLHLREKDILTAENRFVIHLLRLWLKKNRPIEQAREELTEVNPIANRYIEIGLEFRDSRLYEKAIDSFQEALAVAKDNVQAQVNIALVYMDMKAYDKAIIEFEKALVMDDEDVATRAGLCDAHLSLGDSAMAKGRIKDAVISYQRVLTINAEHTEVRQRMAEIARQRAEKALTDGKDEEALSAYAEALKFTPEDPALIARVDQVRVEKKAKVFAALVARSEKEAGAKNWQGAIKSLEDALPLASDDAPIHKRISEIKAAQEKELLEALLAKADAAAKSARWDEAIEALNAVLAAKPNEEVESRLTEVRAKQRDEKLSELKTQARGLARSEQFDKALSLWDQYLALEPSDRETALAEIGQVKNAQALAKSYADAQKAFAKKHYDQAVNLLKGIVNQDENYKDASYLLSQAIELRRTARKWWQSKWIQGGIGLAALLAVAWGMFRFVLPLMNALPTSTVAPTGTSAPIVAPPILDTATASPTATVVPTAIPLMWTRVNSGQFLPRDQITAIVVNPIDPGVMYVGTKNAGIYKSIDGGLSWQPAHNGLGRAAIRSLVMDPQNPNIVYAGVFPGGIYKSTNGGVNWVASKNGMETTYLDAAGELSKVVIDRNNPQHLFHTNGVFFYESNDSGDSWTYYKVTTCPLLPVTGMAINNNTLYLSTSADIDTTAQCPAGLYQSTDWGKSWSLAGLEGVELKPDGLVIDEASGSFYANAIDGRLYISSDGGINWKVSTPTRCNTLVVGSGADGIAYCGGENGRIEITRDGGDSWSDFGMAGTTLIESLAIAPQDEMLAGSLGLYRSSDQGKNWQSLNSGLGSTNIDLKIAPDNPALLFIEEPGCGRLYRSINSGQTWEVINGPTCGLSFGADKKTLYRVSNGITMASTDNGETWSKIITSSNMSWLVANPIIPNVLYGGDPDKTFIFSTDNGITWKNANIQFSNDVMFFDQEGSTVYAIASSRGESNHSKNYRSDDTGLNWIECGYPTENTWTLLGETGLAVDPQDGRHIFLANTGFGVYVSKDGCASWEATNTGLGSLFVKTLTIDPNQPETIYAGTDGGAYVSLDSGQTWGQINDGLLGATVVYSIVVDKDSNVYAATPYGIFKLEGK